MSVLIIACVIGCFAGLNGIKAGWLGSLSALFGLILKSALSVVWVYWMSGLMLLGVVTAALASIIMKNRALKEIIVGTQNIKDQLVVANSTMTKTERNDANSILQANQSKITQKLVLQQKVALKLQGVI